MPPHRQTAKALCDDLGYLIERLSRIHQGRDRTADAKTSKIVAALNNLRAAKANIDAALIPAD